MGAATASSTAAGAETGTDLAGSALPKAACRNVRGSGTAALVSPLVAEGTMQGDLEADLRATRTDLINHGRGAAHSQQIFLPASIHVQRWELETVDPDGEFGGADFSGSPMLEFRYHGRLCGVRAPRRLPVTTNSAGAENDELLDPTRRLDAIHGPPSGGCGPYTPRAPGGPAGGRRL